MKWILIFVISASPQSSPVPIEFDDAEACRAAGRLLEERTKDRLDRKSIWICVPKGKLV